MSNEAGISILKSITNDINDESISTHSLLLRALEAVRILDLPQSSRSWIIQELTGYEDQNEVSTKTLPIFKQLPHYRWVELPARVDIVGKKEGIQAVVPFGVCFPCDFLENTKSSVKLQSAIALSPRGLWEKVTMGTRVLNAYAELPQERIESIIKSIRGFVFDFAVATIATRELDESVSKILENTRRYMSSRLGQLSETLLELMNNTLDLSSGSTEELHWRVILENNRTILRRFTGLLVKEYMTTGELPKEGDTSRKTMLILDWCKQQLNGKRETELEALRKEIRILLDQINKPIHGEISDTTRREVERVLLKSLIWMAGVIDILDEVGYEWS